MSPPHDNCPINSSTPCIFFSQATQNNIHISKRERETERRERMENKGTGKAKAKGKMAEGASSYGEKAEPFFKTKDGSIFPKKKTSVLKMMGKVVVDKVKTNHKTYPQDG